MDAHHLLFGVPGGAGHVYSALGLVHALVRAGHRATVVTWPAYADDVAAAGGRFVPYETAFETFHLPDAVEKPNAEELLHGVYVEDNERMLRTIERVAALDAPDAVVYDEFHFIAGKLLAHELGRPGVRLSGIASNAHYSFWDALRKSHGHKNPEAFPQPRRALRALLDGAEIDLPIRTFWEEIDDLCVVFVPRAFQPRGETFDDRFVFTGPSFTPEWLESRWEPPAGDPPILLVTLGSTWNEHPTFFRTCAEAFEGTPWHVVLAIGELLDPGTLGDLPPNVEVHSWISFVDVLQHAAAFITSGANGAVMAALYRGCPLLVFDHFAAEAGPTAHRAVEIGVGHPLHIEDIEAERLRDAVTRLVSDETVRRRVDEVRVEIERSGGAKRGADAIIEHVARARERQRARLAPPTIAPPAAGPLSR